MKGIISFTDGSFVGKVSEFKTEQAFLQAVEEEYRINEENDETYTVQDVVINHIRFHPHGVEGFPKYDYPDGLYTMSPPGRGGFAVFSVRCN